MTIQEAKETVVLAGKMLVESGLIARTWGNVSCRISDSHFVITPSGRDYLSLTPDEIVEVAISDCSYSGDIKPSSEKGVHAEVYKLHPEVNFVIHTHQNKASAVSALTLGSIPVSKEYPLLGGEVICAAYGLPGTKKLRKGVAIALANSKGNAVIMKNHGALCYGRSYQEAFQVANELESVCDRFIFEKFKNSLKQSNIDLVTLNCLALSQISKRAIHTGEQNRPFTCESERTDTGFRLQAGNKTYDIAFDRYNNTLPPDQDLLTEIQIHNTIYKKHSGINNIIHSVAPGNMAISCADMVIRPMLDDFAQIAGTSLRTVSMDADKISAALKGSSAVFLKKNGVICVGSTKGDALAVGIVTEKNSNALISAALFGKIKYINRLESKLMRFVYLKKYSKQAYKK